MSLNDTSFVCKICGKIYIRKIYYEKHIQTKHLEEVKQTEHSNERFFLEIQEYKTKMEEKKLIELRKIAPELDDEKLILIYEKSISIRQRNVGIHGFFLETYISKILNENNISYKKQVAINSEFLIVGIGKKTKGSRVIDFVIGKDINIDKSIQDYQIISCKTTCRERWDQDEWTLRITLEKYILLTMSNDYPSSQIFKESEQRKIITCMPKKEDDRKYKLDFSHLINEITS